MARSIVDVIINVVTGNANKKVDELDKNVGGLNKTTKEAEKSAKQASGAFATIGNAIKSLGIISVIAGAFNFFKETLLKNQKVADSLAAVFNTISTVINNLISIFINVTDQVSKSTNGFEALGKVMSGILTLAITPLKLAFDGIKLVINEVQLAWEKSWFGDKDQTRIKELTQEINGIKDNLAETGTNAVNAGKDIYNNFSAAVSSVGQVVTGVVNKASKMNVAAIYEQSKATIALKNNAKIAEAQLQGLVEKYDRQAEQLRQVRDDETKSIDERIQANAQLGNVLDEQEKALKKLAQARVAAAAAELAQNKDNVDLQAALIQAQNEVAAVEAKVAGLRSEQLVNGNALAKEKLEIDKSVIASNNKIALEQKKNNADLILDEVQKLETKKALLKEEGDLELTRLQQNIANTKAGTAARAEAEIAFNEKKAELANQGAALDQQIGIARLNNELATIKNIVNANIDQRKEQLEAEQSAIDIAFENKLISEQEYNAKLKELSTQRIAISQEEFDLVVGNVTKIRDSFVNVVSEAGKNLDYQQQLLKQSYDQGLITQDEYNKQSEELARKKAVQERNLALFNLAIDTGVAIAGIVRQASRNPTNLTPPQLILDIAIRSAAVLANIFKARNAINQAKLTSPSSIGGVGGGGAAPVVPSAPLVNTRTQLDSTTIQQLGSATNRAYVVESDVTNSQERIRRINRAARLS